MGFLKKAFFLGLAGALGWTMYYAGENKLLTFLSSEPGEQVQVAKKDRAVKPKSFYGKVKEIVPAPVKKFDYTFFETLDDVDLEQYVDLDGKVKVMKKTVHSWVDEVEKVIHEPRIILASYKEPDGATEKPSSSSYEDIINKLDDLMKEKPKKKVAPPIPLSGSAKRAVPSSSAHAVPATIALKPYMVQVSSFKKLSHARAMESKLKGKGYPAFVMSVQVSPTKGHWYRVFLGKYQTEANARAIAQKAQRLHKLKTIVLKSSQ